MMGVYISFLFIIGNKSIYLLTSYFNYWLNLYNNSVWNNISYKLNVLDNVVSLLHNVIFYLLFFWLDLMELLNINFC